MTLKKSFGSGVGICIETVALIRTGGRPDVSILRLAPCHEPSRVGIVNDSQSEHTIRNLPRSKPELLKCRFAISPSENSALVILLLMALPWVSVNISTPSTFGSMSMTNDSLAAVAAAIGNISIMDLNFLVGFGISLAESSNLRSVFLEVSSDSILCSGLALGVEAPCVILSAVNIVGSDGELIITDRLLSSLEMS